MKHIKRIDTVFVPVTDLERSEKWYLQMFNFKVTYRTPDGNYVSLHFDDPGPPKTALTLYKVDKVPAATHVAFNFYTTDLEATYEFFKSNNVEVTDIEGGDGMRFFGCKDPDGNLLEIVWFPESDEQS
jgi:catechol 2,3-dioxygenase-like lactoylglutathione lyase family enzyme